MEGIRVSIRVRPMNERESVDKPVSWTIDATSVTQPPEARGAAPVTYTFDRVFNSAEKTQSVYDEFARPIVLSAMEGINGTIFVYGQTSSGKTHTMMGDQDEPGVIPRAISDIFSYVEKCTNREFLLRVSFMEIYNEIISDLLQPDSQNLKIKENTDGEIWVADLAEEVVCLPEQFTGILETGMRNRKTASTRMNDRSSRSHTVFRVVIESRESEDGSNEGTEGAVRVAHLNLVDLAGSERVANTGAEGQRLKEGGHINKSLLTLGIVIAKLSEGNTPETGHIPYRDSKLTRILQNSLGGNARTAVICTITPASMHADESLSTLKFASRAKAIKNKAVVNEVYDDQALLRKMKREIGQLRKRNQLLEDGSELRHMKLKQEELEKKLREREEEQSEHRRKIENLQRLFVNAAKLQLVAGNPDPTAAVAGVSSPQPKRGRGGRRKTWAPSEIVLASKTAGVMAEVEQSQPAAMEIEGGAASAAPATATSCSSSSALPFSELDVYKAKAKKLQQALEAREAEVGKLQSQLDAATSAASQDIAGLRQQLADAAQQAATESAAREQEAAALRQQLQQAQEQLEFETDQHTQTQACFEHLQQQQAEAEAAAKAAVAQLEKELQDVRENLEFQEQELQIYRRLEPVQAQLATEKEKSITLEETVTTLLQQAEESQRLVAQLKEAEQLAVQAHLEATDKANQLAESHAVEISRLQASVASLEQQVEQVRRTTKAETEAAFASEMATMKAAVSAANTSQQQAQDTLVTIESRLHNIERKLADAQDELTRYRAIEGGVDEAARSTKIVARLMAQLQVAAADEVEAAVSVKVSAASQLETQLAEARAGNAETEARLSQMQAEFEQAKVGFAEQCANLSGACEKEKQAKDEAVAVAEAKAAEVAALQQQVSTITAQSLEAQASAVRHHAEEVAEYERKLASVTAQLAAAKEQADSFSAELQALQTAFATQTDLLTSTQETMALMEQAHADAVKAHEEQHSAAATEHAQQVAALQAAASTTDTALKEAQGRAEQLEQELATAKAALAAAQAAAAVAAPAATVIAEDTSSTNNPEEEEEPAPKAKSAKRGFLKSLAAASPFHKRSKRKLGSRGDISSPHSAALAESKVEATRLNALKTPRKQGAAGAAAASVPLTLSEAIAEEAAEEQQPEEEEEEDDEITFGSNAHVTAVPTTAELKATIARLEEQLVEAQKALAQANVKAEAYNAVEQQLAQSKEAYAVLERQVLQCKEQVLAETAIKEGLEEKLITSAAAMERLRVAAQTAKEAAAQAEAQAAAAKATVEAGAVQLQAAQSQVAQVQTELAAEKAHVETLKAQLEAESAAKNELYEKAVGFEARTTAAEADLGVALSHAAGLEGTVKALQAQIKEERGEFAKVKEEAEGLRLELAAVGAGQGGTDDSAALEAAQRRIEELETAEGGLVQDLDSAQATIAASTQQVEELKAKIQQLAGQCETLKSQAAEAQSVYEDLKLQFAQAVVQAETAQQAWEQAEEAQRQTSAQVSALEEQLENLTQELETAEIAASEKDKALRDFMRQMEQDGASKSQAAVMAQELGGLRAQLSEAQEALVTASLEKETLEADFNQQLQAAQSRLEAAEKSAAELQRELAQQLDDCVNNDQRCKALEETLAQQQQQQQTWLQEKAAGQAMLQTMQAKLAAYEKEAKSKQAAVTKMQKKLEVLETTMKETEEYTSGREAELQARYEAQSAALAAQQTAVASLTSEVAELQKAKAALAARLASAEDKSARAAAAAPADYEAIKQKNKELLVDLRTAQAQVEQLQDKIAVMQKHQGEAARNAPGIVGMDANYSLKEENKRLKEEHDKELKQLKNTVATLQLELQACQADMQQQLKETAAAGGAKRKPLQSNNGAGEGETSPAARKKPVISLQAPMSTPSNQLFSRAKEEVERRGLRDMLASGTTPRPVIDADDVVPHKPEADKRAKRGAEGPAVTPARAPAASAPAAMDDGPGECKPQ